ncbi:MAG: hypothetical protein JWP29_5649 [Rhodoferax sp.]|nr:hypothetical protein [Rhodoferax sp.]
MKSANTALEISSEAWGKALQIVSLISQIEIFNAIQTWTVVEKMQAIS